MRIASKKLLRVERPRLLTSVLFVIFLLFASFLTIWRTHPPLITESSILKAADANRVPAPSEYGSASHSTTEGQLTKCNHIVLFSSARHGSTWFIDSVERCRYSRSAQKMEDELFASSVFKYTEPWKHNNSALFTMTGSEVAAYVVDNSSVKVFSSTLEKNLAGVEELAKEGAQFGIPFVILRREPEATFRSLRVAKETGIWNGVGTKDVGNVTEMEEFVKYKNGIERYYSRVDDILQGAGVEEVDVVDYDKIKDLKYIRLEQSGCYIRNCNFAD